VLSPPVFTGLTNYKSLVHDDLFWTALGNTCYFALIAVPLMTLVACTLAILLNFNVRGLGLWRIRRNKRSWLPATPHVSRQLSVYRGTIQMLR